MANRMSRALSHVWSVFSNNTSRDPTMQGYSSSYRPDKRSVIIGNEESIVNAIYNRIAIDISKISIEHVRLDDDGKYLETINSQLNTLFNLEANIDQTSYAFTRDLIMSMFDEGCVAVVPVQADIDPDISGGFIIKSLRVGKILEWAPTQIRVRLYNEDTGRFDDVIVDKKYTAIIENPLYATMNERNSTLQRLIRKLQLLDNIDEQSSSGKLDIIIQLPYVIKTQARRDQAEKRRKDIEGQLSGATYGIAYTDGTEKIVQLNRPAENNIMARIEYLTSMLYGQLGLTASVFDGTADEQTMLNYYNRTIEPILAEVVQEYSRKFLTKTARSQKQAIRYFRNPFTMASVERLAEIADKFTRNEIFSPNDVRSIIGWKPSDDPKSDELRNRNITEKRPEETGEEQ